MLRGPPLLIPATAHPLDSSGQWPVTAFIRDGVCRGPRGANLDRAVGYLHTCDKWSPLSLTALYSTMLAACIRPASRRSFVTDAANNTKVWAKDLTTILEDTAKTVATVPKPVKRTGRLRSSFSPSQDVLC